jgi:hypothetical protein
LWTPASLVRQFLVTKAFFLWQIRLAIAVITGRLLNPLGLQPIACKFILGLVSLLLAPMSELK